jgi:hypothetical protein
MKKTEIFDRIETWWRLEAKREALPEPSQLIYRQALKPIDKCESLNGEKETDD